MRNAVSFKFSEDPGRAAGNAVFIELKRRQKEVFYWKGDGKEVDFIVKECLDVIEAIQVCWDPEDERTRKRETKALYRTMDEFDLHRVSL